MKKPKESRGIEEKTDKHQPGKFRLGVTVRCLTKKFKHLLTKTAESPKETVRKKLNALGFTDFMFNLDDYDLPFSTDKDEVKRLREKAENSIIRLKSIMEDSRSAAAFRERILNSPCVLKTLCHKTVRYHGGGAPMGHLTKCSEERISLDEVPQEATEFSTNMLKVMRNVEMDSLAWVKRVFHSVKIKMLASGDMLVEFNIGNEKKPNNYRTEYRILVKI